MTHSNVCNDNCFLAVSEKQDNTYTVYVTVALPMLHDNPLMLIYSTATLHLGFQTSFVWYSRNKRKH